MCGRSIEIGWHATLVAVQETQSAETNALELVLSDLAPNMPRPSRRLLSESIAEATRTGEGGGVNQEGIDHLYSHASELMTHARKAAVAGFLVDLYKANRESIREVVVDQMGPLRDVAEAQAAFFSEVFEAQMAPLREVTEAQAEPCVSG